MELIKIEEREGIKTVNARDLWVSLESKQDFSNWITARSEGFIEGADFTIILLESSGGRPKKEYFIALDMAKHLAMLERNEQGRKIRQYFIDVENTCALQVIQMLCGRSAAYPQTDTPTTRQVFGTD